MLFIAVSQIQLAQAQSTQYKTVDDFVTKLVALDSQNVAQITEALTLKIEDKEFELSYLDVKKNILVLKIDENTFKFQLDVFFNSIV